MTIYWKDNDPPQTVKQVLKISGTVNVDIKSEFDVNMKKLKLTVRLTRSAESRDTHCSPSPFSF